MMEVISVFAEVSPVVTQDNLEKDFFSSIFPQDTVNKTG